MKKFLFACTALIGICVFGQVADANPYSHRHFYGRRHYPSVGAAYYAGYVLYGPRRVYVDDFYYAPPPPVYYCPPPRPVYYEGRVRRNVYEPRSQETYDNSK